MIWKTIKKIIAAPFVLITILGWGLASGFMWLSNIIMGEDSYFLQH